MKHFRWILLFALLVPIPIHADEGASWGLNPGDLNIYWLDELYTSPTGEANLAALSDDANRSTIILIEYVDTERMNYTLGLTNGTNVMRNQTIVVETSNIGGIDVIIPSGDLPVALPISTASHSNYSEYLAASSNAMGGIIANLLEIDDESSVDMTGNIDNTLNIHADAFIGNLSNLSILDLTGFNISDLLSNEALEIGNVSIKLDLSYNLTDGSLEDLYLFFDGDAQINLNGTIIPVQDINGSAAIYRKEYIPFIPPEEVNFSFIGVMMGLIVIPIVIKLRNRIKR
jgi:hypothetical protein